MCGFVGYFSTLGTDDIDLTSASMTIKERGPDMQGVKKGDDWKVAFNRLAIHDLTPQGMQPFTCDDVTVYMNGEIYNYLELQAEHQVEFTAKSGSDVEIIPFLYKKYGLDFLNKLNGMFAIVIIDETTRTRYLVRDRFGQKPLFYHLAGGILYFASEVKAIKQLVPLEVDKTNLHINLSAWLLPQPLTLYKETFNVNPGSFLQYRDGQIEESRWYSPTITRHNDSEEEIEKKFVELLRSSIDFRLRSDVPVGIFLSGGLDSTGIATFANRAYKKKFHAFGANIVGKEQFELNNTDVEIPQKLSANLDFNYQKTTVDYAYFDANIVKIIHHYDELFVNSGVLVFYALSEMAKRNGVSVILTGVAGDELFGGYPWQSYPKRIDRFFRWTYEKLPYSNWVYSTLIKINKKLAIAYKIVTDFKVWHAQSLGITLFGFDMDSARKSIEERIRSYAEQYFRVSHQHVQDDIYNSHNYANIFTVIGSGNHFVDIATMHASVENRSPFLDYRVVEYMMSVPDEFKIKYGQKGLLRKILKKYLPDYVTNAKKSGPTMPLNTWFYREDLPGAIKSFIGKNISLIEAYLPCEVSAKISSDPRWLYAPEHALRLFAIISFVIWAKINITKEITDPAISFETLLKM